MNTSRSRVGRGGLYPLASIAWVGPTRRLNGGPRSRSGDWVNTEVGKLTGSDHPPHTMDYPQSIEELDLDSVVLDDGVVEAVRRFARSKPYRGTIEQRKAKFQKLNEDLAAACGVAAPSLVFDLNEGEDSGQSAYSPFLNVIVLKGRLSVITMLHEAGHGLLGVSETQACRWSLALFRKCFPRSWRRLRFEGHMARAGD